MSTPSVNAAVRTAIRSFLTTVVQASLTSAQIAVTATGYTRADGGSFIADGYAPGAELTATGCTVANNNGQSIITVVTATTLTVAKTPALAVEAAGAQIALVIGFPSSVYYENAPTFIPTQGTPYVRDYLLRSPQSTRRASLGSPARRRHTGIYQAAFFYPQGVGAVAAEAMADACQALCEANETLNANGQPVILQPNASVASGREDGSWWMVPLSIPFYTDTIT